MNPDFSGATYVKDPKACFECHEEDQTAFEHTTHSKVFKTKAPEFGLCESCHGPRSKHIKDEQAYPITGAQYSNVCLQCHQSGKQKHWTSGQHASNDVNCTSCHDVMQKKSEKALLSKARQDDTCYTCHSEVRAELNKSSHHPVREGKMTCSDCHNPHGSPTQSMLVGNSVNETCYTCHQDKRGPFLWEHAPARENCLNCHNSHGSNNRKLQNGKDAFLCMSCHTYGGHINMPRYNRTSNPSGEGCVNCHLTIHGSNSPSGRKFTR